MMKIPTKFALSLVALMLVGCGAASPTEADPIQVAIEATHTAAAFQTAVASGIEATGAATITQSAEATQTADIFQATIAAAVEGTNTAAVPATITLEGSSEGFSLRIVTRG